MRNRLAKWMIVGTLATALVGFYSVKRSNPCKVGVCKERTMEGSEKMMKSTMPMWESITRHLIRM